MQVSQVWLSTNPMRSAWSLDQMVQQIKKEKSEGRRLRAYCWVDRRGCVFLAVNISMPRINYVNLITQGCLVLYKCQANGES